MTCLYSLDDGYCGQPATRQEGRWSSIALCDDHRAELAQDIAAFQEALR